MPDFELKLSAKGMQNFLPELRQNDFQFIAGSKTYPCPHFSARFLSLKIARLYAEDPTIDAYCVEAEDPREQFPTMFGK
jgi:hypothetical protein